MEVSALGRGLENLFRAVVESVLLYGSPIWSLTKKQETKLDGAYTRMLRAVLDLDCKTHPTINRLYGKLPRISSIIRERRRHFAGLCFRRKEESVSDVLLWDPKHGRAKVGRPDKTYPKLLTKVTSAQFADLPNAMENRELCRGLVNSIRATRPI